MAVHGMIVNALDYGQMRDGLTSEAIDNLYAVSWWGFSPGCCETKESGKSIKRCN